MNNNNNDDAFKRADKFFLFAIINTFAIAPTITIWGAILLILLGLKYGGPDTLDYIMEYLYFDYIFVTAVTFIAAVINRIKPGILYRKAAVIIIGSFFVGLILSFWRFEIVPKKEQEKYKQEIAEKKRQHEEQFIQQEKEKVEQQEAKRKNIKNKLLELGYIENNNTYTKNDFEVVIKDDIDVKFTRTINYSKINSYDSTNDLANLDIILNTNNYYSTFSNSINTLFTLLFNNTISNFHFTINDLDVYISKRNSTLTYYVDSSKKHDINSYNNINLDIMLTDTSLYSVRKDLYNLILDYNKDYFKFYDYPYLYLNENNNNNFCTAEINENKKVIKNYCNGGTSNAYFVFSKNGSRNDYIENYVKASYFKENYINIINNDLKYISNKINYECELSEENKQKLTNYLNTNDKNLSLIINDKVKIELGYLTNYSVKYIIK